MPLRVYFKDGRAKVELALARGKRAYDKRQALAEARRRPRGRARDEGSPRLTAHYHGWVALTAHAPGRDVDMGVRGFDFEDRGGGSEPTSPDRRERAGKHKQLPRIHPLHSLPSTN